MNNELEQPERLALKSSRRVFFTMVLHPVNGWVRVGKPYSSRKNAKEWTPFVRKAWRGLRTKVSQCTLVWVGGRLTEKSINTLDTKFNMDAPTEQKGHYVVKKSQKRK
jgi:hypothetical protein